MFLFSRCISPLMFAVDGGISLFKVLGTMDTMGTSGTRVVFLYLRCWGTMDTMDTMGTMDTNRTSVVFLYVRTWGTMDIMGTMGTKDTMGTIHCLYHYFYIFYRPL